MSAIPEGRQIEESDAFEDFESFTEEDFGADFDEYNSFRIGTDDDSMERDNFTQDIFG